jgi:hypothetical protein
MMAGARTFGIPTVNDAGGATRGANYYRVMAR